MSRIGKSPVVLPNGVEVSVGAQEITVKGPLGALTTAAHPAVKVDVQGGNVVCSCVEGAEGAAAAPAAAAPAGDKKAEKKK